MGAAGDLDTIKVSGVFDDDSEKTSVNKAGPEVPEEEARWQAVHTPTYMSDVSDGSGDRK